MIVSSYLSGGVGMKTSTSDQAWMIGHDPSMELRVSIILMLQCGHGSSQIVYIDSVQYMTHNVRMSNCDDYLDYM